MATSSIDGSGYEYGNFTNAPFSLIHFRIFIFFSPALTSQYFSVFIVHSLHPWSSFRSKTTHVGPFDHIFMPTLSFVTLLPVIDFPALDFALMSCLLKTYQCTTYTHVFDIRPPLCSVFNRSYVYDSVLFIGHSIMN